MKPLDKNIPLADQFVESTYDLSKLLTNSLHLRSARAAIDREMQNYRILLRKANRFRLDDDLVDYVTRIAATTQPKQALKRLHSAILPYENTWIEFDLSRKIRTSQEMGTFGGRNVDPETMSRRMGLLLQRDHKRETAWTMTCVSELMKDTFSGDRYVVGPHFAMYLFDAAGDTRVVGGVPSVRSMKVDTDRMDHDTAADMVEGWAWGYTKGHTEEASRPSLPTILEKFGGIAMTKTYVELSTRMPGKAEREKLADFALGDMREQAGMLRWTTTLLALLAEVPVIQSEPRTTQGSRLVGTVRRPYMDYHQLVIKVPRVEPISYLTKKLDRAAAARKRAHEVRAHWRTYEVVAGCDHDWMYNHDDGRRECSKCRAQGVMIKEHVRGDASLGWVRKDYVVEKSEQV